MFKSVQIYRKDAHWSENHFLVHEFFYVRLLVFEMWSILYMADCIIVSLNPSDHHSNIVQRGQRQCLNLALMLSWDASLSENTRIKCIGSNHCSISIEYVFCKVVWCSSFLPTMFYLYSSDASRAIRYIYIYIKDKWSKRPILKNWPPQAQKGNRLIPQYL